jgi:hypothetical protein
MDFIYCTYELFVRWVAIWADVTEPFGRLDISALVLDLMEDLAIVFFHF